MYVYAELSSVSAERVTLSPQKTMLAMSNYIPDFNLTSQQVELSVCVCVCVLRIDLYCVLNCIVSANRHVHLPCSRPKLLPIASDFPHF